MIFIRFGAEPDARAGRSAPAVRIALALLCLAFPEPGSATGSRHVLGDGAPLRCDSVRLDRLACDDRLRHSAPVAQVYARVGGPALPAHRVASEDAAPAAYAAAAVSGPSDPGASTEWLWYALLPGALLVVLALILLLTLRTRSRERSDRAGAGPGKAARSMAFLESRDGSSERHAVITAAYCIGRHSDNDLCIRDASVSRQHAEIHRRRDGSFTITDLDSMNGVFVNQKKIDSVRLADGDIIEIGDKSFCFRMTEHTELTGVETTARETVRRLTPLRDAGERR